MNMHFDCEDVEAVSEDEVRTAPQGPPPHDELRQEKKRYRFNLIGFDQLERRSTSSYLIKGLIPTTGLVVIWGAPKSGKSFLMFDAMLHVALGWEYRGRRVTIGEVVYLALEGQDGFGDRAEAFRRHHAGAVSTVPNFHLVKERTDLVRDHLELIACIKAQSQKPKAVVIDTMNRSLAGSESSDQDMAAYIRPADVIREAFDCAVIIIHHCGLDASRPRGHTSLTGAADVQISIKRDAADNILAEVQCAKDMAQGAVIASKLEVIDLGEDKDGDQMTSCVVVPVEASEVRPAQEGKAKPKLTDAAKIALRALHEALAESGEIIVSSHVPDNTKVVSEKTWREYAYKRSISPDGGTRAKQKAFKLATQKLLTLAIVATWDDQYWLVREKVD